MKSQSTKLKEDQQYKQQTISEVRELCNRFSNLAVSLFHMERQEFIYCSRSFDALLGYCPELLIEGGWERWFALIKPVERPAVREKLTGSMIEKSYRPGGEPLTIDYHIKNGGGKWICIRHEVRFRMFLDELMALSLMFDQSERERLDRYLEMTRPIYNRNNSSIPPHKISDREKEVLKMVASGLPSKQIAKKLFISKHTVISHRKNLIEKFGVKNTAELIYEAAKTNHL